jgi:DMSO/TMAO reductase YedYZ molybdopterin-dependent catalytic subunit
LAIPGKDPRLIPYGSTNLGTPLELIDGLAVPNELFYVRSNGPTPAIESEAWRLHIRGLVDRELSLSLADLQALPRRSVTSFLECAGNGRSRYQPVAEGTTWHNDAIGNAVWSGTSLSNVLDRAGIRDGAVDVVSQGADLPEMRRGLPVALSQDPDVLLVWEMNGEPLPIVHGGPVRLLVPRWGGIASTKWLVELEVLDRPFVGHFQGELYVLTSSSGEKLLPIREMPVKSVIATPMDGQALVAGPTTIAGYAWSGYGGIARVDVSTDGGDTWAEASITERAGPLSWVRFEHRWSAIPGEARLRARATDERGLTQPVTAAWNEKGYLMNAIHEVTVRVE